MKIDLLTLFPEMFSGVMNSSILKRAHEAGHFDYSLVDFRDYTESKHRKVDDYPYGGGAGMVLSPQPIFDAVESLTEQSKTTPRILLMCPQGETFTQKKAEELAKEEHLIVICGHYEGYDERIREHLVTDEISIGDYVLTGGELGAMVVTDSVVRLLPGVLGNDESAKQGFIFHPIYWNIHIIHDRVIFEVTVCPDVLLSGHHQKIEDWREYESLKRTYEPAAGFN